MTKNGLGKLIGLALVGLQFLFLASVCAEVRSVEVRGCVYADLNANKKREGNEKGIAGVLVSDGENVIKSRHNGAYAFTIKVDTENRFVFITKPSGYRPTSPFYLRIDPAGKERSYSADFGLKEDPASRDPNFSFLVTADSQFTNQTAANLLWAEFSQITRTSGNPAFFFNCGDLTMSGYDHEMKMYRWSLEPFTIPVYHIFGGHDGRFAKGVRSIANFEKWLGPAWYSWDHGGRHFITYVSERTFLTEAQKRWQAAWLGKDIAMQPEGTEIIIGTHQPNAKLASWSKNHKIRALFYGHWHENAVSKYKDIPLILTGPIRGGDWAAFTRTYRVCRFQDGKLTTEMRATGQYKRLVAVSPRPGGVVGRGVIPIHVLAYDTPTWVEKVEARIEGPGAKADLSLKNLGQWTWQMKWDTSKLAPGKYAMSLTAANDRGETWSKKVSFQIENAPHPQPQPGPDWPFYLRSYEAMRSAKSELPPPLVLAWVAHTGGRNMPYTSPVFYKGKVCIGIQDNDVDWPGAGIACYDGKTGRELWKTKVDSSIRHTICALDGKIYGLTSMGKVWCLNADTGKVIWKKDLRPRGGHRIFQTAVAPYRDNILVCGDPGPIYLLDAYTGKQIKSYRAYTYHYATPVAHNDVLFTGRRYELYAVDMKTGKQLWKNKTRRAFKYKSTAVLSGGRLYVHSGRLYCVDPKSGQTLWRSPGARGAGRCIFCPTVCDGIAYGGSAEVMAVDVNSGKKLWGFTATQSAESRKRNQRQVIGGASAPVIAGSYLYYGSDNGFVYGLDRKTGKPVWRHEIGMPVKSSPVVSGDTLYISDYDGNLYAFTQAKALAATMKRLQAEAADLPKWPQTPISRRPRAAKPKSRTRKWALCHWAFDEGKGAVARDTGGGEFHGDARGVKWCEGKFGKALQFDGVVASVVLDRLQAGTDSFSAACWVKPQRIRSKRGQGIIMNRHGGETQSGGYVLSLSSRGVAAFNVSDRKHQLTASARSPLAKGKWHHLVGVCDRDKGKLFLYIDGDICDTRVAVEIKGSLDSTIRPVLGARRTYEKRGGDLFFQGVIDELVLVRKALSAEEIKALHKQNAMPKAK